MTDKDHAATLRRLLTEGGIAAEVQEFLPVDRRLAGLLTLAIPTAYIPPAAVRALIGAPRQDVHRSFDRSARSEDGADGSTPIKQSRAHAREECQKWLRETFLTAPQQTSKGAFWDAANKDIIGLSRREFDVAWGVVAPEFGRDKPGAKKKSSR